MMEYQLLMLQKGSNPPGCTSATIATYETSKKSSVWRFIVIFQRISGSDNFNIKILLNDSLVKNQTAKIIA